MVNTDPFFNCGYCVSSKGIGMTASRNGPQKLKNGGIDDANHIEGQRRKGVSERHHRL